MNGGKDETLEDKSEDLADGMIVGGKDGKTVGSIVGILEREGDRIVDGKSD